jgi:hypothetical protein
LNGRADWCFRRFETFIGNMGGLMHFDVRTVRKLCWGGKRRGIIPVMVVE